MPQEQNILQCFACKMYQVHIVKKAKQFNCKICGEKQSIKIIFGRGNGKECREQVQILNKLKMEQKDEYVEPEERQVNFRNETETEIIKINRWNQYLEEEDGDDSDEEANYVSFEQPVKRKSKILPTNAKRKPRNVEDTVPFGSHSIQIKHEVVSRNKMSKFDKYMIEEESEENVVQQFNNNVNTVSDTLRDNPQKSKDSSRFDAEATSLPTKPHQINTTFPKFYKSNSTKDLNPTSCGEVAPASVDKSGTASIFVFNNDVLNLDEILNF